MAETRRGLNCMLSYPRDGGYRTLYIRADVLGHGMTMVADTSSARNARAYYPHKVTPSRFYLRVLLKGYNERKTFADWIQRYADYVMNPGLPAGDSFPDMTVLLPTRNFHREGVPLTGFEWGDTAGAMMWTPVITFECTNEPQDLSVKVSPSRFVAASDPDMKYFWPSGTQLGGNSVPSGNYQNIIDGSDGGSDIGQGEAPILPGDVRQYERDDYGD